VHSKSAPVFLSARNPREDKRLLTELRVALAVDSVAVGKCRDQWVAGESGYQTYR